MRARRSTTTTNVPHAITARRADPTRRDGPTHRDLRSRRRPAARRRAWPTPRLVCRAARRSPWDSPSTATAPTTMSTPIGTLMRNTRRHEISVSAPPAISPATEPTALIAAHTAKGATAGLAGRVGGGHQGHGRRCGDRGRGSLQRTADHQTRLVPRQSAQQRRQRESCHTPDEHALAAEGVPQPATEEHEPAESDHVGRDDPVRTRLGEIQRVTDAGQRERGDRAVEHDQQLHAPEDDDGPPEDARRAACGLRRRERVDTVPTLPERGTPEA